VKALRVALVAGLAFTWSSIALAQDAAPTNNKDEEAREHFTAGVNLLQDPAHPRYDEAYIEFKQAYALKASPTILGNMALCALKLERDAEAIDLYTRYLAESPGLDPQERTQVERDLSTLRAGLAKITVSSRPDGAIIHDTRMPAQGERITNVYGPISGQTELGIRRGHHLIKAHFPGGTEQSWEIDVNGGEAHVFEKPVEPEAPPVVPEPTPDQTRPEQKADRPLTKPIYVSGFVTIGLGAATLVTGILALDAHSRYGKANDGSDPENAADIRSSGKTLNVVSDVLLIGTIIGAGVTAYLYFTRPQKAGSSQMSFVRGTFLSGEF